MVCKKCNKNLPSGYNGTKCPFCNTPLNKGFKNKYVNSDKVDHPQLSLATRGEDWASQGQPKGKAEIPVVTREKPRGSHRLAR